MENRRITPITDDPGKYILDLTGEYIEPEIKSAMVHVISRALMEAVNVECKRISEKWIEENFSGLISLIKPETITNLAIIYASQAFAAKLAMPQEGKNDSGSAIKQ